jgi:hypothetical protein
MNEHEENAPRGFCIGFALSGLLWLAIMLIWWRS